MKTFGDITELCGIADTSECGGLADEITVAAIAPNRASNYQPKVIFASGASSWALPWGLRRVQG